MPSSREIAAQICRECATVLRTGTPAMLVGAISHELAAAEQRGFERAREMAAQVADYTAKNLEDLSTEYLAEMHPDQTARDIAAAIRAIPYAEEDTTESTCGGALTDAPPRISQTAELLGAKPHVDPNKRRAAFEAMREALKMIESACGEHVANWARDEARAALALAAAAENDRG